MGTVKLREGLFPALLSVLRCYCVLRKLIWVCFISDPPALPGWAPGEVESIRQLQRRHHTLLLHGSWQIAMIYTNWNIKLAGMMYTCNNKCFFQPWQTNWHGRPEVDGACMRPKFHCGYEETQKWVHLLQIGYGHYKGFDEKGNEIEMLLQKRYRYCRKCNDWHEYERTLLSSEKLK